MRSWRYCPRTQIVLLVAIELFGAAIVWFALDRLVPLQGSIPGQEFLVRGSSPESSRGSEGRNIVLALIIPYLLLELAGIRRVALMVRPDGLRIGDAMFPWSTIAAVTMLSRNMSARGKLRTRMLTVYCRMMDGTDGPQFDIHDRDIARLRSALRTQGKDVADYDAIMTVHAQHTTGKRWQYLLILGAVILAGLVFGIASLFA
ncbi:hypothetical protein HY632_05105 [Candidatus Uhrbacteria bacterium]|nr:hypothetical protein [Candidatus Uhrbacteria bacterium]